jgi:predicted PilT family ATPase
MQHQRPMRPFEQAAQQGPVQMVQMRSQSLVPQQQAGAIIQGLQEDIKALNSSILVISQKMQYLIRNEKILGRNLIVLSKRIKEFESGGISGSNISEAGLNELRSGLDESLAKSNDYGQKILELQAEIQGIRDRYAKQEELKEMKYIVDTIHPLEFVTIKQVQEMIEKKIKEKKR